MVKLTNDLYTNESTSWLQQRCCTRTEIIILQQKKGPFKYCAFISTLVNKQN